MRVRIKDLKPNPFRDMDNYPLIPEKLESLESSIRQTGFWDNILAREKDGEIQIAYGHHRLKVLLKVFAGNDVVDIPVKPLDDATMIRIMANENDESWGTNPKITNETVRITKQFLEDHPEEIEKLGCPVGQAKAQGIGRKVISIFLNGNWNETRVGYALQQLGLIEEKTLDKESVESMPTDYAARTFTGAVKTIKDVSPRQQKKAAEKIVKGKSFSESAIKSAIIEEKFPTKTPKAKKETMHIEVQDSFKKAIFHLNKMNDEMLTLIKFKEEIKDPIYAEEWQQFQDEMGIFLKNIRDLFPREIFNNVKRING